MFAILPNGPRMFYEASGSGPAIVLIHGLRLSHVSWRHQVPALASGFKIIAPDLRGHGQTDSRPDPTRSSCSPRTWRACWICSTCARRS